MQWGFAPIVSLVQLIVKTFGLFWRVRLNEGDNWTYNIRVGIILHWFFEDILIYRTNFNGTYRYEK